jgi:hypothetical protein
MNPSAASASISAPSALRLWISDLRRRTTWRRVWEFYGTDFTWDELWAVVEAGRRGRVGEMRFTDCRFIGGRRPGVMMIPKPMKLVFVRDCLSDRHLWADGVKATKAS